MTIKTVFNILLLVLFLTGCYYLISGKVEGTNRIILIVLLLGILVYLLMNSSLFNSESQMVTTVSNAREHVTIDYKKVKAYQSNYSYGYWFYIDDWNYKYGEKKLLLTRSDNASGYNPAIYFTPSQNDLTIMISCYNPEFSGGESSPITSETTSDGTTVTSTKQSQQPGQCEYDSMMGGVGANFPGEQSEGTVNFECKIPNINIQKWVHLMVAINNRTLDVFINGKLTKTCMLPGVPRINNESNIELCPGNDLNNLDEDPGFSGFYSKVVFFPFDVTPQQAWNEYRKGFGGSILGSLFNRYDMSFIFKKDNQEQVKINLL